MRRSSFPPRVICRSTKSSWATVLVWGCALNMRSRRSPVVLQKRLPLGATLLPVNPAHSCWGTTCSTARTSRACYGEPGRAWRPRAAPWSSATPSAIPAPSALWSSVMAGASSRSRRSRSIPRAPTRCRGFISTMGRFLTSLLR